MSLYRSMNRGTWIVERRFRGVGQIRHATGTADHLVAQKIEAMLLELGQERLDLVQAVKRRQVTLLALYQAYRRHGLSLQLTVERATPLLDAIEEWAKHAELRPRTLVDYRRNLLKVARLKRAASLPDLPALLERYCARTKRKPFQANQVLSAARTFAADVAPKGRGSELFRDVAGINWLRKPKRNVGLGLTPERAREVAEKLGRLGPMWWTLCCTGMGKTDYWYTRWDVLPDRIIVHGTKTDHRHRVVLRLTTPVRRMCGPRKFAEELARVGGELGLKQLTIYVARRTFAHFLELARILDSRCDSYMGHSPKGDRGKYREHDVVPYLAEDVKAVRAVIGAEPQYVRAVG